MTAAVKITHSFVSHVPDSGDTTTVEPSNWNDFHSLDFQGSGAQYIDGTGNLQNTSSLAFLPLAGGTMTGDADFYDTPNLQNAVVIGTKSWTADSYSGHPITIGKYRYTGDVNAPYGIQNNWLYGQQDGNPYFFYADAPGGGTLYLGDLYNHYGNGTLQISNGNIGANAPNGFQTAIGSNEFLVTGQVGFNLLNIDGSTGVVTTANATLDNGVGSPSFSYQITLYDDLDSTYSTFLQGEGGDLFINAPSSITLDSNVNDITLDSGGLVHINSSTNISLGAPNVSMSGSTLQFVGGSTAYIENPGQQTFVGDGQVLNNGTYLMVDDNLEEVVISVNNTTLATINSVGGLFSGIVTANSFATNGGSGFQFVKGNGALDSTNYLPYKTKGTATLVSGTKAITISGLTTANQAFVTLTTPGGTLGAAHKAVCTTNTLTITAVSTSGSTVTTDTSTLNYLIV